MDKVAVRVKRVNEEVWVDWMIAELSGEPYAALRTELLFMYLSGQASGAELKGKQ